MYFWKHEFEVEDDQEPSYSNLFFIADSLENFIENLVDPSPETQLVESRNIDIRRVGKILSIDPEYL